MPKTAEVIVKVGDIEPLRKMLAGLVELHQPADEEAEWYFDSDGHTERFPECISERECEGHTLTIKVCQECGYEHNGDYPTFREWPCPTLKLVLAVTDA